MAVEIQRPRDVPRRLVYPYATGSLLLSIMRMKHPESLVGRVLWIVTGVVIAVLNARGNEQTVLGFYPPVTGEAIGYDISKAAIAALALWLTYRGIRPIRTDQRAPNTQSS